MLPILPILGAVALLVGLISKATSKQPEIHNHYYGTPPEDESERPTKRSRRPRDFERERKRPRAETQDETPVAVEIDEPETDNGIEPESEGLA